MGQAARRTSEANEVVYVISTLFVISLIVNVAFIDRWIKLARLVLKQEENIEECLDKLNSVYENVGKILQLPLATNDPKVVQIHRELKQAHDCVLIVANRLTFGWSETEVESGESHD